MQKKKKVRIVENPKSEKPQKILSTDYAAWEKFDVEKECEFIDRNTSDSELTDEVDAETMKEASVQKEKVCIMA